jgi:hypothetical protein
MERDRDDRRVGERRDLRDVPEAEGANEEAKDGWSVSGTEDPAFLIKDPE